jgi:Zn-dependent protease with chaperone function
MNARVAMWLGLILLAACVGPAAAQSVPSAAQLKSQMDREPIGVKTWPEWSQRFKAWLRQEPPTTKPAFDAARKFLRDVAPGAARLPRDLERDPVAWYLLGDSYLTEGSGKDGKRFRLDDAETCFRRCLDLDPQLAVARGKFAVTILRAEFDRTRPNAPPPNVDRLKEIRAQLEQGRKADPSLRVLSAFDEGNLALWVKEYADAEKVLQPAVSEKPDDAGLARLLAKAVALNPQRQAGRAAAIKPLAERFPTEGVLAAWHGYALIQDGDRKAGDQELQRARGLGTDPKHVVPDVPEPPPSIGGGVLPASPKGAGWYVLFAVVAIVLAFVLFYAAVIAGMAVTGFVLAGYTRGPGALHLLEAPTDQLVAPGGQVMRTQHETLLTRFYGLALLLALVFFYLAVPPLAVGLLLITGLMLCLTFLAGASGNSSNQPTGDLLRTSGGSLWAILSSSVAGFGSGSFGLRKTARDCPKLFAALNEVARRVDTEPVDEVWLAPGSDIAVHQEGRGPFGLLGAKRRVLTLGVATMHFLTVDELKAILAHEYAHFSHKDTFYNRFIAQVSLSIRKARVGMAQTGGVLTLVNPFYWFFYLYSASFNLLSSGFSRSREFLADRMACSLYGADVFLSGLNKVVTQGSLFESTIHHNLVERLKRGKAFVNMYEAFRGFRDRQLSAVEREEMYAKFVEEKPSLFATHPTYQERVDAVKGLPRSRASDSAPALSLFENPEGVERELTDFLTQHINRSF